MSSRLTALFVWALAAAAAVFWGLRVVATSAPVPPQAQVARSDGLVAGDLSRLLGSAPVAAPAAAPVAPDAASRFRLTGVVATKSVREPGAAPAPGVALIAVDAKPPQAYRVGDALDPRFALQSVGLRSARIAANDGGGSFVLELPPPQAPATGVPAYATAPAVAPPAGAAPPAYAPPPPPIPGPPPGAVPPNGVMPSNLPEQGVPPDTRIR